MLFAPVNAEKVLVDHWIGYSNYRYTFHGMEKDDEVKGAGNSFTTKFRQYDSRIGRWLTIDPLANKFAWSSPYVSFANSPIQFNDPDGDYIRYGVSGKEKRQLKREIRYLKRTVPGFRETWRSFVKDNDRHTFFPLSYTHPTRGTASSDEYPFMKTNSDHMVKDNLRGEGTTLEKKVRGKTIYKTINKQVVNHHHYIGGNVEIDYLSKSFEVQFDQATNQILSGIDEIQEYMSSDIGEITSIESSIGAGGSKDKGGPNVGYEIDGKAVTNVKSKVLEKARISKLKNELSVNKMKTEAVYGPSRRSPNPEASTGHQETTIVTINSKKIKN